MNGREGERSGQAGRGEWGNQATNRREGEISGEEHSNVKRVNCVGRPEGFLEAFGYVFDKEISRISKVSSYPNLADMGQHHVGHVQQWLTSGFGQPAAHHRTPAGRPEFLRARARTLR